MRETRGGEDSRVEYIHMHTPYISVEYSRGGGREGSRQGKGETEILPHTHRPRHSLQIHTALYRFKHFIKGDSTAQHSTSLSLEYVFCMHVVY